MTRPPQIGLAPAAFDQAAARTRCTAATVNAARMVLVEGATITQAARAAGLNHRRSVTKAMRVIRIALRKIQQGEAKRCEACGAMLSRSSTPT